MAGTTLGKLEQVAVRGHWPDEARDFTPWLASDEGLDLLGEVIGIELVLVGQEQPVGPFRADILARDAGVDDHLVIIENQFDKTDHDHLGKIITYAAGLQATTIVWVAETFTDEHRQALDWLNENAGENLAFFGLQVELWKIGDSLPAPQFKVVSSPNEWVKTVKMAETPEMTQTKADQLGFWTELREFGQSYKPSLRYRKPFPQRWYDFAAGRSNFWLYLTIDDVQQRVGCEIYIVGPQSKQAFDLLQAQQDQTEQEIGLPLEWNRRDNKKGSQVVIYHTGVSIKNPQQRQEIMTWMLDMVERFQTVFTPRIKALNLTDVGDGENA